MTKKRIKLKALLLVSIIFLTGCWDYEDIEKKSIVISIGVDRVGEKIELSTEIAKLTAAIAGEKEKVRVSNVYSDTSIGETFEKARIDFDTKRPHPTFLGATRVVIFSENYAEDGIESYLNRINNIYDYRKTVLAVVSKEPPRDLLKTKIGSDISVGFQIEDNLNFLSNKGAALYHTTGELLSDIALGEVGYLLPYVGTDGDSVKYLGLGVFKNSKLIDIVDINDTTGILYVLGDNVRTIEVISSSQHPNNTYSFRVRIKKRRIEADYIDGEILLKLNLDLQAELKYQDFINPISDAEVKNMEKILAEKIREAIIKSIDKSQKKYECDIFGFARYFRGEKPKIYEQIKWSEEYPNANIGVDVKAEIVNLNLYDPNVKKKY